MDSCCGFYGIEYVRERERGRRGGKEGEGGRGRRAGEEATEVTSAWHASTARCTHARVAGTPTRTRSRAALAVLARRALALARARVALGRRLHGPSQVGGSRPKLPPRHGPRTTGPVTRARMPARGRAVGSEGARARGREGGRERGRDGAREGRRLAARHLRRDDGWDWRRCDRLRWRCRGRSVAGRADSGSGRPVLTWDGGREMEGEEEGGEEGIAAWRAREGGREGAGGRGER